MGKIANSWDLKSTSFFVSRGALKEKKSATAGIQTIYCQFPTECSLNAHGTVYLKVVALIRYQMFIDLSPTADFLS